jgi:hypothetical protein
METYTSYRRPEVHDGHTIAELLRDLREETVTLAKQEVALAKSEMKEKAAIVTRNVVYIAAGGLVAYAGLIFLIFAGMRLLTFGLINAGFAASTAAWLSPALIGLVVAIIGGVLILKGKRAFSKETLVPKKTIQSIKEETSWTRTKLREG